MKFIGIRAVTIPTTILLFARYGRASSAPSNSERLRRVRDKSPYRSGIRSNERTLERPHRRILRLPDGGSSSLPLSTTDIPVPAEWSPFEPDPVVIAPAEETAVGGIFGAVVDAADVVPGNFPENGVSFPGPNDVVVVDALFQVGDEDEPYDPFLGMGGDDAGLTPIMSMPVTTSMSTSMSSSMSMPVTTSTTTTTASSSAPDVTPQSVTTGGGGENDYGAYQSNRDEYESALAGGEGREGFSEPSSALAGDGYGSSPSARMGMSLVVVALISTLTGLQLLV